MSRKPMSEQGKRNISIAHIGLKYPPSQGEFTRKRMTGEGNPLWKGDKVGYRALHNWVQGKLGKPSKCGKCGDDTLRPRQYQWANISGKYLRDISDWMRMCVRCHVLFDKQR